MDWFMTKAVHALFWMFGAWVAWLGLAAFDAGADRINQALHEHLCEAPKRVIIVWSRRSDGGLDRRRECKLPSGEVIRVVRNADGQLVHEK